MQVGGASVRNQRISWQLASSASKYAPVECGCELCVVHMRMLATLPTSHMHLQLYNALPLQPWSAAASCVLTTS